MAAPQVTEALMKSSDKILVYFDQPLDDSVQFPSTCFSINYGRIPITGASYYGTAGLLILIDREMTSRDKLEINYQPPEDINVALRSPSPDDASSLFLRRSAVRGFYKVPIKNLLAVDESTWAAQSNLGGGKRFIPDSDNPEFDGSLPGFDICGDGSVIIGNPNNIINQEPNGAVTEISTLSQGSGYTDGEWDLVSVSGGFGSGARLSVQVVNGEVIAAGVGEGGRDYQVGDILAVPGDQWGPGGDGATVEVTEIVDLYAEAAAAGVAPAVDGPVNGGGSIGSNQTKIQDLPYPNIDRPTPRVATPDDFILAYGLREAIQLTNVDDADATQPNTEKMWMAIEDAAALVDNYITQATRAGKLLISSNRRRTCLIIARYYLDTIRRREDVKADYEASITELDRARTLSEMQRPELPWWADPCNPLRGNGIRSHRIPQYYNGVSGKGLDGWWVDSGAEESTDIRIGGENSQNNNNFVASGTSAPREPSQPTDDGGSEAGGE